jgi:hypothetical protein
MRRIAGLAFVALLALASAAHAAPPQRVAGVKLTWPSRSVFKPGERVSLRVRSEHRRAQVALLSGNQVLARKTLRNGTFRATLPSSNRTYRLRATVAGRSFTRTLTTVTCTGTGGVLSSPSQMAAPGATIDWIVNNNGPGCLTLQPSALRFGWTGPDGQAVELNPCNGDVKRPDVPSMCMPALPPLLDLAVGETHTISYHVPAGLAAGRHTVRLGTMSTTLDVNPCFGPTTSAGAQIQLGATSVPAGGNLPYKLLNTGPGCLGTGVGFNLEHLEADGTYSRVDLPYVFILIGLMIPPGGSRDFSAQIPANTAAGTYRITHADSSATFAVSP